MAGGSAVPGGQDAGFRPWSADPVIDGRTVRGSRTRSGMMDAVIELIDAGNPAPTARDVAEQAGVAVRTLYHHFRHLDDLFTRAADRQVTRHRSLITAVPPRGPLEFRVGVLARQRRQLFEAVGPVLQASYARVPLGAALTAVLDGQRGALRQQLDRTLAPELAAQGPLGPVLLDTLNANTGWQCWSMQRFELGHSAAQTERIMVFTVTRLLG